MTHRLIFVCEANICRSPLMEYVLLSRVDATQWEIGSAGTRVGRGGHSMCRRSAEIAASVSGGNVREFDETHSSSAIDVETLRYADLILTASTAERSAVAALAPDVRSRAFTLREAIHLGAEPVRQEEIDQLSEFDDPTLETGLAQYAAILHFRRGFVTPPSAPRTLLRKSTKNPLDIPDAHHAAEREHTAMLERTADEVDQFHHQLWLFLAPATSDSIGR